MTDALGGDIVIDKNAVRFSDSVGSRVTNEQVAVLYRTAERLGKVAVQDRYPTDPDFSSFLETRYGSLSPSKCRRNEHGVPEESIIESIKYQFEKMGKL